MKFEWEDDSLIEGDKPPRRKFIDSVRDHPVVFFLAAVDVMLAIAAYGGKVVMWVIRHVTD